MQHILSDIQDLCISRERSAIDFNTVIQKDIVYDADSYFNALLKLRRDIINCGTIKDNFNNVEIEIKDNIVYIDFFHKDQPDVSVVSFRFCYVPDVKPEEIVDWKISPNGKWANSGWMSIKSDYSGKQDAISVIENIMSEFEKMGLNKINEAIDNIWQNNIVDELHQFQFKVGDVITIIKEQPLDNLPLVDDARNVNHLGESGIVEKVSLDEECPYYLIKFGDGIYRWYGGWCLEK